MPGRASPLGRFIPAWAGNADARERGPPGRTVHPRVGGERGALSGPLQIPPGSSPRGRGTLSTPYAGPPETRFIPAWAGNAPDRAPALRNRAVHPRVGGERAFCIAAQMRAAGSSPRGRGTLDEAELCDTNHRFIPAWAGNAWTPNAEIFLGAVHPRVGGERLGDGPGLRLLFGSSPRGRGTHLRGAHVRRVSRFIPAWAGNASDGLAPWSSPTVHPRVGGERLVPMVTQPPCRGSSPRGRGTRPQALGLGLVNRFIPAWAGNAACGRPWPDGRPVHPRVGGERAFFPASVFP